MESTGPGNLAHPGVDLSRIGDDEWVTGYDLHHCLLLLIIKAVVFIQFVSWGTWINVLWHMIYLAEFEQLFKINWSINCNK